MKIAYADPPYIGCAHLYRDHPDYAGEVDHPAIADNQLRFRGNGDPLISLFLPFIEREEVGVPKRAARL